MRKYLSLILTLCLLFAVSLLVTSCFSPRTTTAESEETTTDPVITTTEEVTSTTTTEAVISSTETTVPETTVPETTEEPATPGLVYTPAGEGFCTVSGFSNDSVTRVVIPSYNDKGEMVLGIDTSAFWMKTGIQEVVIAGTVDKVGSTAFYGCTSLRKVTFKEGVRNISNSAFEACTALESLHVPASVRTIAVSAFRGCTALSSITVADGNAVYRAEGNCLLTKEDNVIFIGCAASRIPDSAVAIGDYAFLNMGVTSALIPENIQVIGVQAYTNNPITNLVMTSGLIEIGDMAFSGCTALRTATLPKTLSKVGIAIFRGCYTMETLAIHPENEFFITRGNCLVEKESGLLIQGLATSTIPSDVKTIGAYAFYGIMIPTCVVPEGVTEIGKYAFANCTFLSDITLPASLTTVADDAFNSCVALKTLTFGGNETAWGALTVTVELPEGLTVTCKGK